MVSKFDRVSIIWVLAGTLSSICSSVIRETNNFNFIILKFILDGGETVITEIYTLYPTHYRDKVCKNNFRYNFIEVLRYMWPMHVSL